jgi:oligosaccharide repeat unit polymerase
MVCFYYLVPKGADIWVILPCLLIFYFLFFKSLQKPIQVGTVSSFIKTDVLFYAFSYLLYYFPYQKYVLGLSTLETHWPVNDYIEYANPSIVLSTIAMLVFAIGYNYNRKESTINTPNFHKPDVLQINNMFIMLFTLAIPLIVYFFAKNGIGVIFLYSSSDVEIQASTGYREICWLVMMMGGMMIYYLKFYRKINLVFLLVSIIVVLWTVFLFVSGDRNSFFINAIILLGGYFTVFKSASRKFLLIAMIGALFIYFLVEVVRTTDERSVDSYIKAYELMQQKEGSSFDITIAGYRATFNIVQDKHDYFYGKFLFLSITSIIPFLSGQLVSPNDPYVSSSATITHNLLGANASWSMGANIVSDLYMDFGIIGVILFMFLIGRFAIYVQNKLVSNTSSLKWVVVYLMTLAMFAELPRYGIAFPIRNLVWTFLFFLLFNILGRKKYA